MINDPVLFHLHHMNETEDIEFWSSLAESAGGSILELGCGTGRILVPLIEEGYQVIGLDINFSALAYLKETLEESMIDHIQVFQSSMDQFHLDASFSLIFLACNTLSTLLSETRTTTYKKIFKHLHPMGVFATSFPNPVQLSDLPKMGDMEIEDTLLHPTTGNPIQVVSGWERSKTSIIFRWHYDQLYPDGEVLRTTVETEHYLTSLEEYIAEMKAEGLNPFQILGDYSYSDYELSSPYVIIMARKET
jgi:SAM-dependent methyltransferase